MNTTPFATDALKDLPPLPEGWRMMGGIPFHAALHQTLREQGGVVGSTFEAARERLAQMRAGTYRSTLTPEETAFLKAWAQRNAGARHDAAGGGGVDKTM